MEQEAPTQIQTYINKERSENYKVYKSQKQKDKDDKESDDQSG